MMPGDGKSLQIPYAGGGTRTRMGLALRCLRPLRLPFRHSGVPARRPRTATTLARRRQRQTVQDVPLGDGHLVVAQSLHGRPAR